jgi:glycosyltransferase involved in cell wall biosynthesis
MEVLFIVFAICAAIQFFFNILSIMKIRRFKMKEHYLDIEDKPLSVIICSHNQLEKLRTLLDKLKVQAYTDFEIIVVDDRSEDGTYDYLLQLEKKWNNLRLVRIEWTPRHINEKKYAISLGIRAASHDNLLLTDADCEPGSMYWIKTMMNQFHDKVDFVLGFSYYKTYPGLLNMFIRHETLQTAILYLTLALSGIPYMGVGRNLGYRKSFFLEKKGFSKMLDVVGGDDDLFVNRFATSKNTSPVIHPDAVIFSEPKRSFRAYMIQKLRHLSVGKKYRVKHKAILGIYTLSKLIFWIGGLSLVLLSYHLLWVMAVILTVLLLSLWSFREISKKFDVIYEFGWVWLMDFMYISFLAIFSLSAFSSKKIKWS